MIASCHFKNRGVRHDSEWVTSIAAKIPDQESDLYSCKLCNSPYIIYHVTYISKFGKLESLEFDKDWRLCRRKFDRGGPLGCNNNAVATYLIKPKQISKCEGHTNLPQCKFQSVHATQNSHNGHTKFEFGMTIVVILCDIHILEFTVYGCILDSTPVSYMGCAWQLYDTIAISLLQSCFLNLSFGYL